MRNECGLRDEEFEARIELGLTGEVMLKVSTTTYKQETSTYIKQRHDQIQHSVYVFLGRGLLHVVRRPKRP